MQMVLCCAAQAESDSTALYAHLMDESHVEDDAQDEYDWEHPGRGAPGRTREKGKFYGHPDESVVAKDIIGMEELAESSPEYAARHKEWRFSYRVPYSVFKVHSYIRTFERSYVRPFILSSVRPFVLSSVRPFVRAFVRTFIRSDVRSYVRTSVRPYIRTSVRSYVRSYRRSYVRSYVRTFVRTFVRSYVRTFVRSYVRTFVRSYVRSLF